MPLSKRAKKVSLTKTKKEVGGEKRSAYVETVRRCIEENDLVIALSIGKETRPTQFKNLRKVLGTTSRLFLGKKTLMRVALGNSPEEAIYPGLDELSSKIEGGMALVVTSASLEEIESTLSSFANEEFATAGFEATRTIVLERGLLPNFPTSMLETLRKLGVPAEVKDSNLELVDSYCAAKEGSPLSPEQAKMLKHLDIKLDSFAPKIVDSWQKKTS